MDYYWLVVLTILKTISQWEELSHILWKIKKMFETSNQIIMFPIRLPQIGGCTPFSDPRILVWSV